MLLRKWLRIIGFGGIKGNGIWIFYRFFFICQLESMLFFAIHSIENFRERVFHASNAFYNEKTEFGDCFLLKILDCSSL